MLGATIIEFKKVSPTASYLLLPYLAWSTYAAALTASIYKLNPKVNLIVVILLSIASPDQAEPDSDENKTNSCTGG